MTTLDSCSLRLPEDGTALSECQCTPSTVAAERTNGQTNDDGGDDGSGSTLTLSTPQLSCAKGLRLLDLRGGLLATAYRRVLYGDHGPYLEFTAEQLEEGRRQRPWRTETEGEGEETCEIELDFA